jgi:hypothetical protein
LTLAAYGRLHHRPDRFVNTCVVSNPTPLFDTEVRVRTTEASRAIEHGDIRSGS